jgi:hypothetical protein
VVVVVILRHTGGPVVDGDIAHLSLSRRVVVIAHNLVLAHAGSLARLFVLLSNKNII